MPGSPPQDPFLGGHALVLCGYQDDTAAPGGGWHIFRNSWSPAWGDGGYGYLPYAYLADQYLCYGLWSATLPQEVNPVSASQEIVVNGKSIGMGRMIVPGEVWAPVRMLAEGLGATVEHVTTASGQGEVLITLPKA